MASSYKRLLLLLAIVSLVLMILMNYDADYRFTIVLPIVYFLFTYWFFRDDRLSYGPCSKSLMAFYGFRMCILPVICAYGNFWLEADKSLILTKYNLGIFLMCLEFIIIVVSLYHFNKKNKERIAYFSSNDKMSLTRNSFFTQVVWGLSFLFVLLFVTVGPDYFHFITGEMDELLRGEEPTGHAGFWYLEDFVCTLVRPLFSFLIVGFYLKNRSLKGSIVIVLVILFNFLFVSDRRIYSLLISGTCIYYIILSTNNKRIRFALNTFMAVGAVFMVYACLFFQISNGEEMLSRTIQHYFSGPSLNSMALIANERFDYTLIHFLKLMWNCSFFLCALFSSFPGTAEYESIFGFAAWTPMFMDCIRYFSILAPLFLVLFVRFIVKCDDRIKNSREVVFKMTYLFIGVTMSCYMIMYTLHLVLYFMIATNLIYRCLMGDLFKKEKGLISTVK